MNITELRKLFEIIKRKVDTFEERRVEGAYQDLLLLVTLADELNDQVKDQDLFEPPYDPDKVQAITDRYHQLAAILKAIHFFANILYDVLLSEVTNRAKFAVNDLVRKPDPRLKRLSTQRILPAYCVVAYRNKVIAHHDVRRMSSFKFKSGALQLRLIPFPERLHLERTNVEIINQLRYKYKDDIKELEAEVNAYNLLRILFYGVPIGELGSVNPDRKKIDRILEAGGCISMTADEIIVATDEFIVAVVDAL